MPLNDREKAALEQYCKEKFCYPASDPEDVRDLKICSSGEAEYKTILWMLSESAGLNLKDFAEKVAFSEITNTIEIKRKVNSLNEEAQMNLAIEFDKIVASKAGPMSRMKSLKMMNYIFYRIEPK